MLTQERLQKELEASQQGEEQMYKKLTLELYKKLQDPLKALYREMVVATANLTGISAQTLQQHPQIIKILRYCLAPTISQMRLGQIVGVGSTRPFEVDGTKPSDEVAGELARWIENYLDRDRFPWTRPDPPSWSDSERRIAEDYAQLCTVALVSNQNTDTLYRNKRQKLQEGAIVASLVKIGLTFQPKLGQDQPKRPRRKKGDPPHPPAPARPNGISNIDDVQPGRYLKEQVVLAGMQRNHKSDLTARPAQQPSLFNPPRLFCIEAKAVGIRIDSTKRLKELNDKFTDWNACSLQIFTVGVCAGFFNSIELMATIRVKGSRSSSSTTWIRWESSSARGTTTDHPGIRICSSPRFRRRSCKRVWKKLPPRRMRTNRLCKTPRKSNERFAQSPSSTNAPLSGVLSGRRCVRLPCKTSSPPGRVQLGKALISHASRSRIDSWTDEAGVYGKRDCPYALVRADESGHLLRAYDEERE